MNLLFVTPSYKPAFVYGGPTVSVSELAESLVHIGHKVTVYTTTANGQSELDVPLGVPVCNNGVTVYYFRRITGDHTHVSPALWLHFARTHRQFHQVHLHSWWSFLILGTALVCRLANRRYILSPRGMLGDYSFTHQHGTVKRYLHKLVGKPLLRHSILHATTALEWRDCMKVQGNWKGFIAHNIISLPEVQPTQRDSIHDYLVVGFLSRIDPKKGLELLFEALAQVSFPFRLLIAGSGDAVYIASLKALSDRLGIAESIEWCGWMEGMEKFRFLRSVDLFVLPSYNENFAIVVTESLAVGTPVLVSKQVGLADYVQEKGLGWVCAVEVNAIRNDLVAINAATDARRQIAARAPEFISKDFDKLILAQSYANAYAKFKDER